MKPSTRQSVYHSGLPSGLRKGRGKVSSQRGLSLIELMISITIGLIILVALSTLFINQSRSRIELDKSNRMIDNGRYALQLLTDDLRLAGFYGEFTPVSGVPAVPASLPDPCSTSPSNMAAALQLSIQGYDAATPTSNISSPPCGLTYTAGSDLTLKPGSDIVVVRHTSTAIPIAQTAAVSGKFYLQASLCQFDSSPVVISTTPANFTLRKLNCTSTSTAPYADLRQFMVDVYYVSPNDKVTAGVGDGVPTLKRMELDPVTNAFVVKPLVEGIDFMQLDYGMDTTGDGIADSYITSPAATDWPDVVAVKMNLLARNTETTKGYTDNKTYSLGSAGSVTPNDNYKRHSYSQYIRLINPAGRREVQ